MSNTKNIDVHENGKNWDKNCKYCQNEAFTQIYLIHFQLFTVDNNTILTNILEYNYLFKGDIKEQILVKTIIKKQKNSF